MRQIALDTETTGLQWQKGHRVIEIACVELQDSQPTWRTFHRYLNPERELELGAEEITGLTREFLADKPRFNEVADEFLTFIDGAELIIHHAEFDLGFMNHELSLLGPQYGYLQDRVVSITDTLPLARALFPGQRCSLDSLCKRLGIDIPNEQTGYTALDDARLALEVYLKLSSMPQD